MGVVTFIVAPFAVMIFLIISLFFTLFVYYRLEQKTKLSSFVFRIVFIGVVLLISLVIRLLCTISITDFSNPNVSFFNSIKGIYYTIAGFGFEGQDFNPENIEPTTAVAAYFYFATLLWMAFTFILVVTIGLSYEIYSWFALFKSRKSKEVFIFEFATEDTITLADSIKEKKENALIIFAGDELGKFDRENEIHQKIKIRKYLYINLYKNVKQKVGTPILVRLHLINKEIEKKQFHIIAFQNGKDKKGLEAINSDIAFDDIKYGLNNEEYRNYFVSSNPVRKDKDGDYCNTISYYILSNNSLNYEFYDMKLNDIYHQSSLYQEIDNEEMIKKNKENKEAMRRFIKIKIINEADLTGFDLMRKRHDAILSNETQKGTIVTNKCINYSKDNKHTAIILGFGQTGQAALNNLYIDSSSVNPNIDKEYDLFVPYEFNAYVYDEDIEEMGGVFEQLHPSYLFQRKVDKDGNIFYSNEDSLKKVYQEKYYDFVKKYLGFAKIHFYKKNVKSIELLEELDTVTYSEGENYPSKWKDVDFIAICTGNDDSNITIANAILQDIRQELFSKTTPVDKRSPIEIYVNIRDENNEHRLLWNDALESVEHPWVKVKAFGAASTIYSVDNIILNNEVGIEKMYKEVSNESFSETNFYSAYHSYANKLADMFADYYEEYLNKLCEKEPNKDQINYLYQLEHLRWARALFSMGGLYIENNQVKALEKKGIMIDKYSFSYDRTKDYIKEFLRLNSNLLPAYSIKAKKQLCIDEGVVIYDVNNATVYPKRRIKVK